MKTTDHKLVNKCISDSHVCCRFHSLVCGCRLSQSHKSKFAFETKKKRTTNGTKSSTFSFENFIVAIWVFINVYLIKKYVRLLIVLACKAQDLLCTGFRCEGRRIAYVCVWLMFECFFHYVPITNSISIWLGSTWAQPHTPTPALNSSELKLSIQHSAHTHTFIGHINWSQMVRAFSVHRPFQALLIIMIAH